MPAYRGLICPVQCGFNMLYVHLFFSVLYVLLIFQHMYYLFFSGIDLRPPGGFLNFIQTGHPPFVPPQFAFSVPCLPMAPTTNSCLTQHAKSSSKHKSVINIDDGNDVRTWEKDEDKKLVRKILILSDKLLIHFSLRI